MQHAITIGDVVWWTVGVLGVCTVLGVIIAILAAYGRGMSR